jgi:hypothetical protein
MALSKNEHAQHRKDISTDFTEVISLLVPGVVSLFMLFFLCNRVCHLNLSQHFIIICHSIQSSLVINHMFPIAIIYFRLLDVSYDIKRI